jgi:hypothetical protein
MRPLLSPERVEGQLLQAPHLGLQEPQVHQRGASVVLTLGVFDAADQEDRHAAAVRAAHLDALKLAAAHETEGAEKQVVRLEHVSLPCGPREESWGTVRSIEVSPSLLYLGPAPVPAKEARRRSALPV